MAVPFLCSPTSNPFLTLVGILILFDHHFHTINLGLPPTALLFCFMVVMHGNYSFFSPTIFHFYQQFSDDIGVVGLQVFELFQFYHFGGDGVEVADEFGFVAGLGVVEFEDAFGEDGKQELEVVVVAGLLLAGGKTAVHAHSVVYYCYWVERNIEYIE